MRFARQLFIGFVLLGSVVQVVGGVALHSLQCAGDVAAMPDTGAFDLITAFDAIHDQAQPAAVLKSEAFRSRNPPRISAAP